MAGSHHLNLVFSVVIYFLIFQTTNSEVNTSIIYDNGTTNSIANSTANSTKNGTTNSTTNASIVCYLSMGGVYEEKLPPALNLDYCTHVIFLGSVINDSVLAPRKPSDIQYYYKRVQDIKILKPLLKILLSNSGSFEEVLVSSVNRKRFAESVIPYFLDYGFDGLDLDWEFPAWGRFRSKPEQKHNFTLVLQTLRETFDNYTMPRKLPKYLLTTAVASTLPLILGCYEIPQMSQYVDFINLMSYDIHGFGKTTPFTGHNSPMHSGQSFLDKTIFFYYNMVSACELWVQYGMKKSQIMVGIPAYGRTFVLLSEKLHGVYSLATGFNTTLGDEINRAFICKLLNDTSFNQVWDNDCAVPYAYSGTTWISYDNKQSITQKVKWILENKYGGIMTFSLDSDDYVGQQCGVKWPIHTNIFNAVKEYTPIQ